MKECHDAAAFAIGLVAQSVCRQAGGCLCSRPDIPASCSTWRDTSEREQGKVKREKKKKSKEERRGEKSKKKIGDEGGGGGKEGKSGKVGVHSIVFDLLSLSVVCFSFFSFFSSFFFFLFLFYFFLSCAVGGVRQADSSKLVNKAKFFPFGL